MSLNAMGAMALTDQQVSGGTRKPYQCSSKAVGKDEGKYKFPLKVRRKKKEVDASSEDHINNSIWFHSLFYNNVE